jgi:Ca2+-binding RTX toxin-like protein
MASFFGSGLGDVILPTQVSPAVVVNPVGALPTLLAASILGGLGADTIDGGGGADTVAGGDGDDVIRVRADALPFFSGAGQFLGNAGNDRFIVTSVVAGTVIDGGTGTDTLVVRANLDVSQSSLASIEALAPGGFLLTIRPDQLAGPVAIGADGAATIGNLALTTAGPPPPR